MTARPRTLLFTAALAAIIAAVAVTAVLLTRPHHPATVALPLRRTGEMPLPGDSSRFDYASLAGVHAAGQPGWPSRRRRCGIRDWPRHR